MKFVLEEYVTMIEYLSTSYQKLRKSKSISTEAHTLGWLEKERKRIWHDWKTRYMHVALHERTQVHRELRKLDHIATALRLDLLEYTMKHWQLEFNRLLQPLRQESQNSHH